MGKKQRTTHIQKTWNALVRRLEKGVRQVARSASHHVHRVHHHVAHRPHTFLMQKLSWYNRWHSWQFHKHAHVSVLVPYSFVLMAVFLFVYHQTYATDTYQTWDFSNSADYSYNQDRIELGDGFARLKAQNYSADDNTNALLHFDEPNGQSANDTSINGNDGTLIGTAEFSNGNLNNGLLLNGTSDYVNIADSSSLRLSGAHTLEAWTKFDDGFDINASQDAGVIDKGSYRLYYNSSTGKVNYEIENSNANSWVRQGGLESNGSWDQDGKTIVRSTVADGDDVYVGLGLGAGDAEVWHWDGSSWEQIGGDDINGSWANQTFEDVHSLVLSGGTLYAGLGSTAGDAEVWRWNGTSWTKIGGDAINSSWQLNTFEGVFALNVLGSNLYAGLGNSANDAEVWRWNGTSWTKIGGDSLNSGWTTNFESVRSLTNDGTNVYAGIGDTAADAEVWRWNGTSWTMIGGDGVNSSWAVADNIEYVSSLEYFGGNLYAGTSLTAGDADVWRWNGTSWTKIGGDGVNSSWAASTYEIVGTLTNDGTNLYAGLGNSNGDGEVYRWNGTAWTKIGGDSLNNSWTSNQGDGVYALAYSNGKLYAGMYDSGGDAVFFSWNGTTWTQTGGGYINYSWGFYGLQSVESSTVFDSRLYVGTGVSTAGNAMVWQFDGTSWTLIGGQGVRGSWQPNTYENVFTLQSYNGDLYAGLGSSANDAEVWRYNGSTWTQVGGDSLNSGWTTNFESVYSLAPHDGYLYAGLGSSGNDAEVWRWNGTAWTKIGGDSLNSGWTTNFEIVYSLTVYNGDLYAGLGSSTNDAEVWRWNGTSWTKIGGDGLSSSWNTDYEEVFAMRIYDDELYVGLGSGTGDAEIWRYNGTSWSKIGGDDVNSSWSDGTYERVRSMAVYNGQLYVGIGDSTGDGEVWRWNGTSWTKIGGNGLNSGWTTTIEYASTMIDYRGKLYAGTGSSANSDAIVWSYGANGYLSSEQTVQDNNWHHLAATYDGTTMRLYIDGELDNSVNTAVTVATSPLDLKIGSTYGSGGRGEAQGYLKGQIDEVRISNTARTSFTTKPYPTSAQTLVLGNAVLKSGIESFQGFTVDENLDGGTITYQLSDDDGETWKYWDGETWAIASSISNSNAPAIIDNQISTFPVTFNGITWRAVLDSDGDQQIALNSVTVQAIQDLSAPSANASAIIAQKSAGGSSLAADHWTNGSSPFFSWDEGFDADAGIYGYCLYLGQDESADPRTTKGILGSSPSATGENCQFVTAEASIDLSEAGSFDTALTSSINPYYLLVSAIDKAGNIVSSPASFSFRFDNTAPSNPIFVSAPSGFVNTKDITITWPTSGGQAPSDSASGLAGLQYKIGDSPWYGDQHSGTGDVTDLLENDGSYSTLPTPDHDNISDGTNTVYFRTWDNAGNVTTSYVSAALKINTAGSPSEPRSLTASPSTNTVNSFSFNWNVPDSFVGEASSLNYCYTFNVAPSAYTCNYTGTGNRSLPAGPYATLPGVNTLYVVARDESGNINYGAFATTEFTANTTAPGIPGNLDIVDVSIKASSKWRLAITWDVPTSNADTIASYRIYRSIDNENFTLAGTSSSTTYIDAGLSQITYYYRITACDSTNNCSANSPEVSLLPTGKFTEAAVMIDQPRVSNVTTKRATIDWTTDRASDSRLAIGTSSGQYGVSEIGSSDQVAAHSIDLDNLAAGTTYYYVVKWTDVDGNTGISQEQTFQTSPAPVMKEVTTSKIGLSDAIITFTSVNATKVNLYYGKSEGFGGLQTINTSAEESQYSVNITGLDDGAKYYYQLAAVDSEGTEYKGNVFSFNTPDRPRISNLRFQPIKGEPTSTQSISWTTNVPTTSTITYGILGTAGTDVQNSQMTTEHNIKISGLEDDSQYFLIAQGRDRSGNLVVSDQQTFKTALDTRPPTVSDVTIESSIRGSGSEARGQVIVSWNTDEPSTSQVGYAEGSTATVFNNKTSEDTQLTTQHIVVLSNLPTSKVYSIQVMSYDKARNVGTSEPQTSIIGRANESVLTLILGSLQRIFGL